jgi:hypothetical protein
MPLIPLGPIVEKPNTRFIYLRAAAGGQIQYDAGGQSQIILDPTTGRFVDITGYRRVSVFVSTQHATGGVLTMGYISGNTAAQQFKLAIDGTIKTFDVVGPEIAVDLTGPPNTTDQIQLWVYLRS